jgi:hypothetical protein
MRWRGDPVLRALNSLVGSEPDTLHAHGRIPYAAAPPDPIVIQRLVSCEAGFAVVARATPDARGRFRVSLPRMSAGAALYRAQTRVPHRGGRGGSLETSALTLRVDPAR